MKDFNLENVGNLLKLKEAFSNTIDKKINNARLNEAISSIGEMPLLELNSIFESLSDKLYENKNGKKLIKRYIKALKENKELNTLYKLHTTVKNGRGIDNPTLFLQESLSLGKTIDKGEYNNGLSKLRDIIKECVIDASFSLDDINNAIETYNGSINESLDYLSNNEKTFNNVGEYVNAMSKIVTYLSENNVKNSISENTKTAKELVEDLNGAFENELEIWESRVIKDVALSQINGKTKSDLFEEYKTNCISRIDSALDESETEKAARLTEMKRKLNEKAFNEETINEDLLKLSELYEALS